MLLAYGEEQVYKEDISLSTCLLLLKCKSVIESPAKNQCCIFQISSEIYILCSLFQDSLDYKI